MAVGAPAQQINVSKGDYTLFELTRGISAQHNVSFSYNTAVLSSATRIELRHHYSDLGQLLQTLRQHYHIRYKQVGSHVVLYRRKARRRKVRRKPPPVVSPVPATVSDTTGLVTTGQRIGPYGLIGPLNLPDSFWHRDLSAGAVLAEDIPYTLTESSINTHELYRSSGLHNDPKSGLQFRIMGALSIYADELFVLNPQVHLGVSNLYATLSYAYRSAEARHLRYGLGYRQQLGDKHSLYLYANYGRPQWERSVAYDSLVLEPDSTNQVIRVSDAVLAKASLWKAGINYEYQLYKQVRIQLGLVYNHMHTRFYLSSTDAALRLDALNPGYAVTRPEPFDLGSAPYVLRSDLSMNRPEYTRIWLGLQAGIYIQLFPTD